jgi:arginine deiminase
MEVVVFAIDGVPLKLNIYKNIELSKQKNIKIICFALSDLTQGMKAILAESILI